jgi:hypothetical protein
VFGDEQQIKIAIIVGDYKSAVSDFADETTKASKSVRKSTKDQEKAYGEMDDATKKQKAFLQLRADELDMEIRRLDAMSDSAENKRRKQMLQDQIDELRKQSDAMDLEAKKLEYENRFGEAYDSILDEIDKVPPQMQSKGLTIMQRLQKGLKDGWGGVQRELRLMADDFGETFGVENMSGEIDEVLDSSGFATLPQDFAMAQAQQAMSDLGMGGGALTNGLTEGAKYVFNVLSVDEAMQAKQTQQNKEKLRYTRR